MYQWKSVYLSMVTTQLLLNVSPPKTARTQDIPNQGKPVPKNEKIRTRAMRQLKPH